MKKIKVYRTQICIILLLILLISCTKLQAPYQVEDQTYRTPISDSTLKAYHAETPIANKLQAVIAARDLLSSMRMDNLQTPEVIDVQRITLTEAKKKANKPGEQTYEGISPDTPVWFVIFKGKWQVHPPSPGITATPPLPYQGCQYVWIAEANNGYAATGDIACPNK